MAPFTYHALGAVGLRGTLWAAVAVALAAFPAMIFAAGAMSRGRTALLVLAASAAFFAGWGHRQASLPLAPLATDRSLPDIVLLVMDTTRRDRLSVYGHPRPTTPGLELFAREGTVYDDAWSVSPWTPPSHASIFTGLLPAVHGIDGQFEPPFDFDGDTLPEVLSQAGYRTAGFVANYMLHAPGWKNLFDVYLPPEFTQNHSLVAPMNFFFRGFGKEERLARPSKHVLERAKTWWKANPEGPRFLFVNLLDPHWPYRPSKQFYDRFLDGVDPEEAYEKTYHELRYYANPGLSARDRDLVGRRYDAEIAGMDQQIGYFVQWLRDRGDLNNTLFVITADHGERLGERGLMGHALVVDPYLLRVPLLVRYPEKVPCKREPRRVQLDGLPGYILHLAGVPAPEAMSQSALNGPEHLQRPAAIRAVSAPRVVPRPPLREGARVRPRTLPGRLVLRGGRGAVSGAAGRATRGAGSPHGARAGSGLPGRRDRALPGKGRSAAGRSEEATPFPTGEGAAEKPTRRSAV